MALRRRSAGDFLTVNGKNSLTWLGTTRARLGFVATPDNRLMIYATGGVAYGGGNSQFSAFDATTDSFWSGNPSSSRVGWTIGGGVEYAITNNITIKGEYLYADLGSSKFNTIGNAASPLLPGRHCDREDRLERLDLPRGRELQVLSFQSFELRRSWPEEGQPSSGFFCTFVAAMGGMGGPRPEIMGRARRAWPALPPLRRRDRRPGLKAGS